MAKLSTISTPSLTFDEGAAPGTPASNDVILYAKSDGLLYSKDDAGAETLVSGSTGGSGSTLLGQANYAPGTDTTIYTGTTTPALADTTNLSVTFTAPASGKVMVRFTGVANVGSSPADQYWAVWESGALIGSNTRKVAGASFFGTVCASFYITGISAGSHTYKWAMYKVAANASLLSGGPLYGTALMEVWSA